MNKTQVKLDAIRKLLEMPTESTPENYNKWTNWETSRPRGELFLCYSKVNNFYAVCTYEDGCIKDTFTGEAFFHEQFNDYYWKPIEKFTDDEPPF